ncbi:phosphoserine phosphatase SerB [Sphingomonas sp. ID0503]|uniref:phosphoserine phosphatase SerB n=1 Tax=Sphingomonas sp. ID0503 TaxID=3399691 RepID=UPI003AFABB23
MFIATLIAADRLNPSDISAALDALSDAGLSATVRDVEAGKASDLCFDGHAVVARAALEPLNAGIDVVVQREADRAKRLLVADMDSTMITVECIDELADYAGIKAEIAEVTERAMRGELDFEAALDARVALLKGLEEGAIDRCLKERVRIMPGAKALVRTVKARGGRCVLVSGGFTVFADKVAAEIGFDRALSNTLGIAGGTLTGTVARPIVGAETKRQVLLEEMARGAVPRAATIAIGDGANDIPMIREAGLGVAYHAKPKTAEAAAARIDAGDLSVLLYAMGVPKAEWAAEA